MFASLGALPSVGLDEVDRRAARLTRVDRKYVVAAELADDLVVSLPAGTWSALEIDGSRVFGYESNYYDSQPPDYSNKSNRTYRHKGQPVVLLMSPLQLDHT